VAKAKTFYGKFQTGYTQAVRNLVLFRSTAAAQEIDKASDDLKKKAFDSNAPVGDLSNLLGTLLNRVGYGVNLVNAAARAADLHKTTFTSADTTALDQLKTVAQDLKQGTPAAGDTSPGSPFGKVQPVLEAKARLVNTAATLRSALVAYASAPSDQTKKTALEAVALAQQTFVGQFWGDPGLQSHLIPLP
jgi:hypothetical protein